LFEALGFPVVDLHRERIGGLSVKGIPPGAFRPLSRGEVELLEQKSLKRWGASAFARDALRRTRQSPARLREASAVPPEPEGRRRKGVGGRGVRGTNGRKGSTGPGVRGAKRPTHTKK
jgi:hypothetical protein